MNTFLPYPDFAASAACLDRARLGKQRVEVLQLLQGSFVNHPASRMWRGYEHALAVYGTYICAEWISRGYRDTVFDKLQQYLAPKVHVVTKSFHDGSTLSYFADETGTAVNLSPCTDMPPWFGAHQFHSDCRANLLRKDFAHYSQFGWSEAPKKGYTWPTTPAGS